MKVPFARCVRTFCTSQRHRVLCWPKHDYGPMEVQRTTLMNGVKVASAKPTGAQIGACTIMFQAGSRFEVDDRIGASHFLRTCSPTSGNTYTSFTKTRMLQQYGAYITCSNDRQSIAYTIRCPTSTFNTLKDILLDMAARCCYAEYDVKARRIEVRRELDRIPHEQLVMDLVQKACWGGALANSPFCEDGRIDGMTAEDLNWYTTTNFRTDGCSVGSVGLPFEEVVNLAEQIELRREKPAPRCVMPSFPRAGFEYHDLGPNSDTWIALAVPGCGTMDLACLMKHSMVAAACGTGDIGRGQHLQDRSPQTPIGLLAKGDLYGSYKAFNVSYSDTGVFGVVAKTRSITANRAAYAAAQFLQNVGSLTLEQLEIGKRRLKLGVAINDDDCVRIAEGLALQGANGCILDSAAATIAQLDSIPAAEASVVAQNLSEKTKCQMAVAVVGDVQAVPHDRELTCS